jgi:hypothetical protein
LKKAVTKEVADLVARALERDVTKRFPNVDAMLEAVRKLGARAVGRHEDVAAHVARVCGQSGAEALGAVALNSDADAPVSNRPTVPPQSARSTAPPAGVDPEATKLGSMRPTALTLPNFVLPTDAGLPSEPPESIEPELISEADEGIELIEPVSIQPDAVGSEAPVKGPPPAPSALRTPKAAPPFPLPVASRSVADEPSESTTDLTAADQALAGLPGSRGNRGGLSRPVLFGGVALLGLIAVVVVVRAFGSSPEAPQTKTSSVNSATPASGGTPSRSPSVKASLRGKEPPSAPTAAAVADTPTSEPSVSPPVEDTVEIPPVPTAPAPQPQPVFAPRRPSAPATPRPQPAQPPPPKPPSTTKQPFRPSGI